MKENEEGPSLINRNCKITGSLVSNSTVRIEGIYEGEELHADQVLVGVSGEVRSNVHANVVIVFGSVQGSITSRDLLAIRETGRVSGHIRTKQLQLDKGAMYEGKITMEANQYLYLCI